MQDENLVKIFPTLSAIMSVVFVESRRHHRVYELQRQVVANDVTSYGTEGICPLDVCHLI